MTLSYAMEVFIQRGELAFAEILQRQADSDTRTHAEFIRWLAECQSDSIQGCCTILSRPDAAALSVNQLLKVSESREESITYYFRLAPYVLVRAIWSEEDGDELTMYDAAAYDWFFSEIWPHWQKADLKAAQGGTSVWRYSMPEPEPGSVRIDEHSGRLMFHPPPASSTVLIFIQKPVILSACQLAA